MKILANNITHASKGQQFGLSFEASDLDLKIGDLIECYK